MSNNDRLTEAEFNSWRPNPLMVERIERCRSRFGLAQRQFRIVDWGCGRGKLVLWLRECGYDAVGVDIDPRPFANGDDLFRSRGHAPEQCLYALDPASRAPFPDSSCHFVTSWQTLEHVRDFQAVVGEWARLTMDGGGGFHIYPPHHRLVEGHLFMPFVHWLPKNAARRWLIAAFVLLGVEPNWSPGQRWREKVRAYYRYSVEETYYRTPGVVRRCLAAEGFDTEFVDVEGSEPGRTLAGRWLGTTSFGNNVGLATTRQKRIPAA